MGLQRIRAGATAIFLIAAFFAANGAFGQRGASTKSPPPDSPAAPAQAESAQSGGAQSGPALAFTGNTFPSPSVLQELFTVNADGSGRTQLTNDGLNRFLPHFSPDGTKLLYTKFLVGGYGAPNVVTEAAVFDRMTGQETLLTGSGVAVQPVWSPDGRRIAFGTLTGDAIWLMNADGSDQRPIAHPSGALDDLRWGDYLWSPDNWIYFSVAQDVGGCFKVRIDRMRPNASGRVKITDGGPYCTPPGLEQSGDADPGISPDGRTIYSSRGLPATVPGYPSITIRHLYKFSSAPYTRGKRETDLSLRSAAPCVAGVPKVSSTGKNIALFLNCPGDPQHAGVTLTDPNGGSFVFVTPGFGADWNPAAR